MLDTRYPIGQFSGKYLEMSFLGLEGLHVFVTGAAGGIGSQAVQEFLGMYVFSSLCTTSFD